MALIKCPECGNSISTDAETCIHCGYGIKKAADEARKQEYYASDSWKNLKRTILLSVAAILIIIIAVSCNNANIEKEKADFGGTYYAWNSGLEPKYPVTFYFSDDSSYGYYNYDGVSWDFSWKRNGNTITIYPTFGSSFTGEYKAIQGEHSKLIGVITFSKYPGYIYEKRYD